MESRVLWKNTLTNATVFRLFSRTNCQNGLRFRSAQGKWDMLQRDRQVQPGKGLCVKVSDSSQASREWKRNSSKNSATFPSHAGPFPEWYSRWKSQTKVSEAKRRNLFQQRSLSSTTHFCFFRNRNQKKKKSITAHLCLAVAGHEH